MDLIEVYGKLRADLETLLGHSLMTYSRFCLLIGLDIDKNERNNFLSQLFPGTHIVINQVFSEWIGLHCNDIEYVATIVLKSSVPDLIDWMGVTKTTQNGQNYTTVPFNWLARFLQLVNTDQSLEMAHMLDVILLTRGLYDIYIHHSKLHSSIIHEISKRKVFIVALLKANSNSYLLYNTTHIAYIKIRDEIRSDARELFMTTNNTCVLNWQQILDQHSQITVVHCDEICIQFNSRLDEQQTIACINGIIAK